MKKKICAPESIAPSLGEFISKEGINIEIVPAPPCDIKVIQCTERKASDMETIYSGGWISCRTARSLAEKLNISLMQTGLLLNQLDVKIRNCALGCFK